MASETEICHECHDLVKVDALNQVSPDFVLMRGIWERIIPSDFTKPRTSHGCRDNLSLGDFVFWSTLWPAIFSKQRERFGTNGLFI